MVSGRTKTRDTTLNLTYNTPTRDEDRTTKQVVLIAKLQRDLILILH